MVSFLSKAVISLSICCFVLGLLFTIIGYATFWLTPREQYSSSTGQIDGVGLRQACFTLFRFIQYTNVGTQFDGCYDNSRLSARFEGLPQDVWSPRKCTMYFRKYSM